MMAEPSGQLLLPLPGLSAPASAPAPAPPSASPLDISALARALAIFAAVGISIVVCVRQLVSIDLNAFLTKNELPFDRRVRVLVEMLAAMSVLVGGALGYLFAMRRRKETERGILGLHRAAMFLLPLTLLWAAPPLFRWSPWTSEPLNFLLFASALGLTLEPMLRASMKAVPAALVRTRERLAARVPPWLSPALARGAPPVIVGLGAAGYAAFAAYYTILHHQRFGTACFDLGQYDNLFYNALHGHPFRVTSVAGDVDWKSLRGHAEIGAYALLPFYAIKPGSEGLLVIQAVMLGSGAIPVYLFSRRFLTRWPAMIFALSYLLYPGLHRANFYDFHMQPIAAIYILWALYFLVAGRDRLFWVAFALAITAREDISLGLAVLGVFLIVTGYRSRLGVAVTVTSLVYFVVLKFAIMPLFGNWWFADIYKLLKAPGGSGYGAVVATILSNPTYFFTTLLTKEKVIYALHMLLPLAFLPIRRLHLAMSLLPGFFFTLMTTAYSPTTSINFQYNAHWFAYVFPASVVALAALRAGRGAPLGAAVAAPAARGAIAAAAGGEVTSDEGEAIVRQRAALVTMVVLLLATSYQFGALLQRNNFKGGFTNVQFRISPEEQQRYRDLGEILKFIPQGASVAATEHLAPHVSTRSSLYCFRDSVGAAEYVLDAKFDEGYSVPKVVREIQSKGEFSVIAEKGAFKLLKRNAKPGAK